MTYCATQEKRHIQAAGPSQQVPLACMCVSARLRVCVCVRARSLSGVSVNGVQDVFCWEREKRVLPPPRINISAAGAEQEAPSTRRAELTFPTRHGSHLPLAGRSPGRPTQQAVGRSLRPAKQYFGR